MSDRLVRSYHGNGTSNTNNDNDSTVHDEQELTMARQEEINRRREARKVYDIVTVGEGRKPQKPQPPADPIRASDGVPLYRYQPREAFQHDVPNMKQPSTAVVGVRTLINQSQSNKKVVPPLTITDKSGERNAPHSAPSATEAGQLVLASDYQHHSTALLKSQGLRPFEDPDKMLMLSVQKAMQTRPKGTMGGDNGASVAPNDDVEIMKLKDAEEAVAYFSQHGSTTSVKYVYLNKAGETLDFRPYDLSVVLRGQQNPEHYVISNTGVVHVKPSNPSEVVSLSDWMRESAQFNVLRKIRFFKNYLTYKAFLNWRRNIRFRLYCETRRKLCKNFFLSKATFAAPTIDLMRSAYDLTTVKLINNASKPDFTISEYTNLQAQQRAKASLEFSANVERMETRLSKLTDAIQQRANVPDLTSMESLEQYLLANAMATGANKKGHRKTKSMIEAKREQFERMCELKRSMVEFELLDRYIRLVDYMASEMVFKNALLTVADFVQRIAAQKGDESRNTGFQILLVTTEDGMIYQPSQSDVEKVCTELIEDLVSTINGVNRLLNQKPLKVYFAKAPKIWNIGSQLKLDARVVASQSATKAMITEDFRDANARLPIYKGTRDCYRFIDAEWPAIRSEWSQPDRLATLTHADINEMYERYRLANDGLRILNMHFIGHLLQVHAHRLKQDLEPKLNAIKAEVDKVLIGVAIARTEALKKYYIDTKGGLITPDPSKNVDVRLGRYVEIARNLNAANAVKLKKDEEAEEASELFALIDAKDAKASTTENNTLALLRDRTLGSATQQNTEMSYRDQLDDVMSKASEFCRINKADCTRQLNEDVKKVHVTCEVHTRELQSDDFSSISADDPVKLSTILEQLAAIKENLEQCHRDKETLTEYASLLSTTVEWGPLTEAQTIFDVRNEVWTLLDTYNRKVDLWFDTPIKELEVTEIDQEVKELYQKSYKLNNLMQSNNFRDDVCVHLLDSLKELKEHMPVILDCGNKNMTTEHWNRIFAQIGGGVYTYNEGLNLNTLRERDIYSWKDVIAEQSGIATGEASLRKVVEGIESVWQTVSFVTKKYKEDRNVYILQSLDEVSQYLDDQQVQLQTLMASRYVAGVRARVEEWLLRVRLISDVLEEWVTLQKNWMYLENIFASDDIKRQLPQESERFDVVDHLFKDLMAKANTIKNVLQICTEDGLLEQIRANNRAIDEIQKRLEDYLTTKRVAFPRFYFLSNDELLEILSDVRNPAAVQPHLSKCFDSISSLIFGNAQSTEILAMKSGQGEEVAFDHVVNPIGSVEQWLCQIESTMKSSLYMHMRDTIEAYPQSTREEWFFSWPAQCVQTVDMIIWTNEVETAIANMQLRQYHADYHKQIIGAVDLVKTPLSKLQRTVVCTLIVVDVHNRDVVQRLIDANTQNITDFEWQQQLRFYWIHNHAMNGLDVGIQHCSANLWYGYEYIGNQLRLVITPLTDRAFLTCTSALGMNLGASPQGPAGTGKTESVKDLGKALARQVVVFNCSDGIDYKTMGRMFSGLAQAGAWACFDEFNRIELEVLSVIAQQMLEIVMALGQNLDTMEFDGNPIKLSRNFGVFITMNPGYAGRTELPDNLKALFRPICMMIPDYALIAEIMIYSEGFGNARVLAQKMAQLYKLSSEQLSKQDHYDFGMRAVKSILVMAGALKRDNPNESEDMLLIRAMRDSNIPKFLRDDTVLFMALIKDLFPNIDIEEKGNDLLVKYLHQEMQKDGLQIVEGFTKKTLQLFDTLLVRHGVMMVGQTFCAKTAIVDSLQKSLTKIKADGHDPKGDMPLYNTIKIHLLNPKSITMGELYGEVNPITKEWTDGILSNIARGITREFQDNQHRQWVMFDGPVDAIWVESMNTVLDDSKMLCLFNGERIKLPPTATFMFEVQDLRVASPATVSRCGMVFVEPFYLDGNRGWKPATRSLAAAKAAHLPNFRRQRVLELLDAIADDALDVIRTQCGEYIPSVDAQLAVSCIELLAGFVKSMDDPYDDMPMDDDSSSPFADSAPTATPAVSVAISAAITEGDSTGTIQASSSEQQQQLLPQSPTQKILDAFKRPAVTHKEVKPNADTLFDMYFLMAFVWSFGGNLDDNSRHKFDDYIRPILKKLLPNVFPAECSSIYELTVHRPSMKFIRWDHIVPNFTYNPNLPYFELFVPTAESTALKSLMRTLTSVSRSVCVSGVTGVGKSVIVTDFLGATLKGDDPESHWEYFATALSAQTQSKDIEDRLESKLSKVRTNVLGPTPGKKAIFFVDDLNMPALEKYGASPPIELLRQLMTQGGFFDRKKQPAVFKEVKDVIFVAACGVPGGGRNEVTARFTSRFHLLCQASVSDKSTSRIFTSILAGFLGDFQEEIQSLTRTLIESTKECYGQIAKEKRPTPDKSHYIFNLRDFGRVIQGLLQVRPDRVDGKEGFLRLWIHEVSRVFHDRLTDVADREWWWKALSSVVERNFDTTWLPSYEQLIFGDYMNQAHRSYEEVSSVQDLQTKLLDYQQAYNIDNNKETELVFFADAAHHLSRITRICRQPRGHCLLVGVGGSGRQSLTRLAAYICEMPILQIAVTRSYNMTDFHDNVREILLKSGCNNQPVVFLLSDSQIVKEAMLEDVNNILSTGEIPNLMQTEDIDQILEAMRPLVRAAGKLESRSVMLQHFVQLCRDNVHIVLCMSPVGESFRRRLRMFPSLVNCCTIDWFSKWPAEALIGVARRTFANLHVDEETKDALCKMCVFMHQDVEQLSTHFLEEMRRHNYTTPTSYLELLNSYMSMLDEQNQQISSQIKRLGGGLDKLQSTQVMVDEMKLKLVKMKPELEASAVATAQMVVDVEKEKAESIILEGQCVKEEEAAMAIKRTADAVRSECQVELDKAMPGLLAAEAAVNNLNANSISEIRTFTKPPEKVGLVMEGVLILMVPGIRKDELKWERSKAMLGPNFINQLRNFARDDIDEKTIRTLEKHWICSPEVTDETISSTSHATVTLYNWVKAIRSYYVNSRNVKPKKEQLAIAEAKLEEAQKSQQAAVDMLAGAQRKVADAQSRLQATIDEKKRLEEEMKRTELRLGRASKLMSGLASEQIRWTSSVEALKASRVTVVGTVAVAAGSVAYLGPFTAPYRHRASSKWVEECRRLRIPIPDKDFVLSDIADPVKIRQWGAQSLPMDDFSVDNGIITTRSQRYCLCIDPQGQANAWIRNMEAENKLKIIKLSDNNYMRTLENAIKVGVPVLLENIEESLDAALDAVLLRQTFKSQGRLMLRLGDQDIDYDPNFRFYMTTKLPNPHYLPELQIKVTIINFTVTQKGLEDQLLGEVVGYEYAELEQRAGQTVIEIARGKKELKDTEDKILSLLASSSDNILDNQVLIDTLQEAKKTSESITQSLEVAEATQKDIALARNRYRPVATRGSLIYAVIASISEIDHMYQISLEFFKMLFKYTLGRTEKHEDVDKRVNILLPAITLDSYTTVCRGLFEKDKQLFVFMLVTQIFREQGEIKPDEWNFFLKGSEGRKLFETEDERWPEWTTEACWNELHELILVPGFENLKNEIWASEEEWGVWATTDTAYSRYPIALRHMNEWQKLVVLKVFREDLVSYGMTKVVGHYLGAAFTESPPFDLESCYAESSPTAPIIFVLTAGTDPTATFTEFAEKRGFGERKLMLSLGQDQGPKAQEMISTACRNGSWVYLQNCHVYASWMPQLERILEDIMLRAVHKDFRLWLTTMPNPSFPVLVLQSGIKVVKEPPKGLKANLRDSFLLAVTPELWESCPQNATNWKRLLFSLSYFHAIIQERRRFGASGWNIPYEWNQSDFSASIKSLFTYLSDYEGVPWTALQYMTGVINYGGRVTDFLDQRCLQTILGRFFSDEVTREGQFDITADGVYCVPADVSNIDTVKDYLTNLPPFEQPELFGLHSNADIAYNRATSRKQLQTLLSVQPRTRVGGGVSMEDKVLDQAAEFARRLPASIDKSKAHEETYRITADGTMISLGTVCSQEIDVFNAVLEKLKTSLVELQRAIKGEVVMSAKLESMFNAFLLGRVPDNWHENSYLSLKPLASWFEDTLNRIEFLRDWNDGGTPVSFWISGFFFPQGFLTGVLQTHSRAHKMPINDIKFRTNVTHYQTPDQVEMAAESGVYIHGLYMEGARFNRETMAVDESVKGELFTTVPVIWLEPVNRSVVTATSDTYACPLYKTSARAGALSTTGLSTNFVLSLDLDAGQNPPEHWVLRGVALLCMLDD